MSLLRGIQTSLLQQGHDLAPVLLKLRLLASRLGSDLLEDWVRHETEGYPKNVEVPDYRKIQVSYTGTFSGPFGSGIRNAPIPTSLIKKFAGEKWTRHEVRQSIASVDNLLATGNDDGILAINASDLILLLQGKVYEDWACNSVTGTVSKAAVVELQNAVRTRILELTIELERKIPSAAEISLGPTVVPPARNHAEAVTQITQQTIYGNVTAISSSGPHAQFIVNFGVRDRTGLMKALVAAGIAEPDANELAEIVASEEPESQEEPFGKQAKAWLAKNLGKAVDGTWKVSMNVATSVLTEAALKYYGLK